MDKLQFKRYQILDECFSNKYKKYTFDELLKKVNEEMYDYNNTSVSVRTLRSDIQYMMEAYGAEFDDTLKVGKKKIYRYKDLKFTIQKSEISPREVSTLKEAFLVIQRIQGLDDFGWIVDELPKFQNLVGEQKPVVSFNKNVTEYNVKNLFLTLYDAIVEQKVLKITYQDFKANKPYEIIFHPYFIKEYNKRWFVFGLNPERNIFTWNLAFDRIIDLDVLQNQTYIPNDFNWTDDYFDDMVGVTRQLDSTHQKVVIQVDNLTYKYIESKPIHGTQKRITYDDNFTTFFIEVILNKELIRELMAFGPRLKVLEPQSLVEEIKSELQESILLYQ